MPWAGMPAGVFNFEPMSRKGWDEYFMDIAMMVSARSTCPRRQVGAVLVRDREIKATGYNGAPRGLPDCLEAGCIIEHGHCVRTVHAEQNVILFSDRADRDGATLYVTDQPCFTCAKMIANSGIARVVYFRPYPHGPVDTAQYLREAGIAVDVVVPSMLPPGTGQPT